MGDAKRKKKKNEKWKNDFWVIQRIFFAQETMCEKNATRITVNKKTHTLSIKITQKW